jgi:hypothetical protein
VTVSFLLGAEMAASSKQQQDMASRSVVAQQDGQLADLQRQLDSSRQAATGMEIKVADLVQQLAEAKAQASVSNATVLTRTCC